MRMTSEAFNAHVQEAVERLPDDVGRYFDNVAVLVADQPTERQARAGRQGTLLLGLYEGVPRIAREGRDVLFPDRITLFQKALEDVSRTEAELREHVVVTLWHEIGHHLGFPDRKLRTIERRILRRLRQ